MNATPRKGHWTDKELTDDTNTEVLHYEQMVKDLESPVDVSREALTNDNNLRMLHAAIGIGTEGGELLDMMKKVLFAKKPLDATNALEELGDVLWYLQLGLNVLGYSIEECMLVNRKKLALRHGAKFNLTAAGDYASRNLDAERALLESSTKPA